LNKKTITLYSSAEAAAAGGIIARNTARFLESNIFTS